jgi:hypothetical protein
MTLDQVRCKFCIVATFAATLGSGASFAAPDEEARTGAPFSVTKLFAK